MMTMNHAMWSVVLERVIQWHMPTAFIHSHLKQSVQQISEDVKYDEHEGKDVQHQVQVQR